MRLHILVVHVDVVQLPLLLKNLLGGACGSWGSGGRTPEDGPTGNQPDPAGKSGPRATPPGTCGQDGAGPVLTGHVGHLHLQALDVGHVHVEERLGLGNGAPDARQGDVGQAAAAVHCGDSGGEAARAPAAPPSQPAGWLLGAVSSSKALKPNGHVSVFVSRGPA